MGEINRVRKEKREKDTEKRTERDTEKKRERSSM